MKAISTESLQWQLYPGQRATTTEYLPLHQGVPGDLGNYELTIVRTGAGGSFSPRHRHNFEQFRYAFQHPVNYGPKLDLPPGQFGYFPEGAYYGPFTLPEGTEWLIVQFGGLSGAGYLGWQDLMRGYTELKETGEFKGGVYRSTDSTGKAFNKDGYEAIWEHINQNSRIKYPKPKYREPIIMDPYAFEWHDDPHSPGISRRVLGVFGERGPAASQIRLSPDVIYKGPEHPGIALIVVIAGEARTQDRSFPIRSAFALEPDEAVEIETLDDKQAELLVMHLPVFR